MEIKIELGFSHIRDSIARINAVLAERLSEDQRPEDVSLNHLRNALYGALPADLRKLVKKAGRA
jgi:hypothetical protein